jgi:hypothetical protein
LAYGQGLKLVPVCLFRYARVGAILLTQARQIRRGSRALLQRAPGHVRGRRRQRRRTLLRGRRPSTFQARRGELRRTTAIRRGPTKADRQTLSFSLCVAERASLRADSGSVHCRNCGGLNERPPHLGSRRIRAIAAPPRVPIRRVRGCRAALGAGARESAGRAADQRDVETRPTATSMIDQIQKLEDPRNFSH